MVSPARPGPAARSAQGSDAMLRNRRNPGTYLLAVLTASALTAFMAVPSASAATAASAATGARAGTTASSATAASAKWTIESSPNVTVPGGQIQSVSCASADACTAVGSDTATSGLTVTLAESWNGTAWHRQTTPNPASDTTPAVDPALTGVSCPTASFCEAVGGYGSNGNGTAGGVLAETWNGTSWALQSVPVPSGSSNQVLHQVSCTSATFCEAVGSDNDSSGAVVPLAETWNGTAWSVQSVPGPSGALLAVLSGVSCASAAFCEAMGGGSTPFADAWNGTSWQSQSLPGTAGYGPVSCTSADFCAAVGGSGGAVWNGTAWTAQAIPVVASGDFNTFGAVSCVSDGFCEATGNYSNGSGTESALAETWNGTAWSVQSAPGPSGASFTSLNGVSCATASWCEAGGDYQQTSQSPTLTALAEAWNGSSWTTQEAVTPAAAVSNSLNAVSCPSTGFCEAVGSATDASSNITGLAEVWNGTAWKIQSLPQPAEASSGARAILRGVSCVSAKFCEAVGYSAATPGAGAWVWNGTSWTAQTVTGPVLIAVSCASASFCTAVSSEGDATMWNGTSWSAQSATAPGFTGLNSVSCPTAGFCAAVGLVSSEDSAETWNGSSWTAQATPTPAGGSSLALNSVSCTAASFCETAGWYFDSSFNQLTVAEEWNGSTWSAQTTPNPSTSTVNSLNGVWCTSARSCTSVGFQAPSFINATLAEAWNGTSWSLLTTPNRASAGNNVLNGVSCGTKHACTAVGETTDRGQINATLVEAGS